MAFSEIDLKRCERDIAKFMEMRRPPPHIRPELDFGYRITGQSVEIFEVRPDWQDKSKTMETPVAKTTYVRSGDCWKLYWMRGDLKWHSYQPRATVRSLAEALKVVGDDQHCCFFG